MEDNVPLVALKRFYNEISLLQAVEIESYDSMGQLNKQIQITATHPDLGIVTIRQDSCTVRLLADHLFEFEEEDIRCEDLGDNYDRMEGLCAKALKTLHFKANRSGIPITKISLNRLDQLI